MELHRTFSDKMERGSVFVYSGANGLGELSPEEQKAVEAAWWNTRNSELPWTCENSRYNYFGNFDGTVVILENVGGMLGVSYNSTIDGISFGVGQYMIWAYRDGELLSLGEGYEKGWLERADLFTIRNYKLLVDMIKY